MSLTTYRFRRVLAPQVYQAIQLDTDRFLDDLDTVLVLRKLDLDLDIELASSCIAVISIEADPVHSAVIEEALNEALSVWGAA